MGYLILVAIFSLLACRVVFWILKKIDDIRHEGDNKR